MHRILIAALLLASSVLCQNWTLTPRGPACDGHLLGQVITAPAGQGLRLGVVGAQPNALAVLVIGVPEAVPVSLPGSNCLLFVDARAYRRDLTNHAGNVGFALRLPPMPLTFYLQAVTVRLAPVGVVARSTNVLEVVGV